MRVASARGFRRNLSSFTLIELLVVMFIIALLAALTVMAGEGALKSAARSRARAEIQAMTTALESYKTDNGIYPLANIMLNPSSYSTMDGSSAGSYQNASQLLFQALSGKTNFDTAPTAGVKYYMSFKANQIGNPTLYSYVNDPFGYSYGYNTGDTATPQVSPPYSGTGFYDLWSTGGALSTTANPTNSWISNWNQ